MSSVCRSMPDMACNYHNVRPIVAIPHIAELNIGHAIVSEAVFIGLEQAVKNMKALLVA